MNRVETCMHNKCMGLYENLTLKIVGSCCTRPPFPQTESLFTGYLQSSSETQGRSVGPGEKARQKFSSTGGKAPGYRLSPDHFQTVKRMLAPDWAQKCFVLLFPIGEQHLLSSFREFVHDGYWLDHGLSGSCTKEMHAVRNLSVWYKRCISKYW